MKTTGKEDGKVGGFPLVSPGEYLVVFMEGITFEPKESDGPTKAALCIPMAIAEGDFQSAVLSLWINQNEDPDSKAQQISEQSIANVLASVPGSTPGKSLGAEFEEHYAAIESWFDPTVVDQIKIKLPGKYARATVFHNKYTDSAGKEHVNARVKALKPVKSAGQAGVSSPTSASDGQGKDPSW